MQFWNKLLGWLLEKCMFKYCTISKMICDSGLSINKVKLCALVRLNTMRVYKMDFMTG